MAEPQRQARRSRVRLAPGGLLAALALAACDAPPPRAKDQWPISLAELGATAAAAQAADPGERAYQRTCIACHGADGHGNGGKTGADFASPTGPLTKPDAQLLGSILDGTRGPIGVMPPHRTLLTDTEATAALAYVRRSFGAGIVPTAEAAADAGAARPADAAAQPASAPPARSPP